jgi:hypothetical protein
MKAMKHSWLRLKLSQRNIPDFKEKKHNEKLGSDSTTAARQIKAVLRIREVSTDPGSEFLCSGQGFGSGSGLI